MKGRKCRFALCALGLSAALAGPTHTAWVASCT